jgi:hypothetical protein
LRLLQKFDWLWDLGLAPTERLAFA